MTERFTILYETEENPMEWDLIDNQEDCLIVTGNGKAICDLLNELDSENKKLKNKLGTYKTGNALIKNTLNRYKNENQQIKDTITEMYNNERTYIGKSVLKQLLEAIQ